MFSIEFDKTKLKKIERFFDQEIRDQLKDFREIFKELQPIVREEVLARNIESGKATWPPKESYRKWKKKKFGKEVTVPIGQGRTTKRTVIYTPRQHLRLTGRMLEVARNHQIFTITRKTLRFSRSKFLQRVPYAAKFLDRESSNFADIKDESTRRRINKILADYIDRKMEHLAFRAGIDYKRSR